jgi:hypothetical protein
MFKSAVKKAGNGSIKQQNDQKAVNTALTCAEAVRGHLGRAQHMLLLLLPFAWATAAVAVAVLLLLTAPGSVWGCIPAACCIQGVDRVMCVFACFVLASRRLNAVPMSFVYAWGA